MKLSTKRELLFNPNSFLNRTRYYLAPTTTILLLIAMAFSLYWPALTSGLVSDDWDLSLENTNPWTSWLGHWFGGGKGHFYRPLSRLLIYYEARLFGYSGLGQHFVSMALFLSTIGTVCAMVWRNVGFKGAVITGMLLITFPGFASVTSWIASQTDLLTAFFMALSIFPFAVDPRFMTRRSLVFSLGCAFLAYLSKESATVLGPLAVIYVAYVVVLWWPANLKETKWAVSAGIGHVILMALYLLFRIWRFGQVGVGEYDPPEGKIWHAGQLYTSAIRDILIPFTDLFPAPPAESLSTISVLWPLVLTGLIIAALLSQGQVTISILLAGFVTSLIPLLTVAAPYYYPENGMADVRRYLYIPGFFLMASVGIALGRKEHSTGGIILAVGLVSVLQGMQAQSRILEYAKAGAFTKEMQQAMQTAIVSDAKPIFYVGNLPDTFGSAYVFRNGFQSMAKTMYPYSRTYQVNSTPMGQLPAGNIYVVSGTGPGDISINSLAAVIKNRSAAQAEKPRPYILNFNQTPSLLQEIKFNEMVTASIADNTVLLNVVGPDPMIFIKPALYASHSQYSQISITLDFVDSGDPASGNMQYFWMLASGEKGPHVINQTVKIQPGTQTVVFNVEDHPFWFSENRIHWHRIDLPDNYRGYVKLLSIEIK